jgi:protein-S-isoprenylcysteine O-methyltransferase Ste14
MDQARYALALILLISLPPALLFWLFVHPLVRFWRSIGLVRTYCLVSPPLLALMATLFWLREPLLATEFGVQTPLIALGMLLLAVAIRLALALRKQVTVRILAGLPELDPDRDRSRLVTEGIYARIRHPRYVEGTLAVLGWALIVNTLAIYLLLALFLPAIGLIVVLEERELRDRFGEQYQEYCQRVPRFLPRFNAPS